MDTDVRIDGRVSRSSISEESSTSAHVLSPGSEQILMARACTECHRQKQRCNRQQPCSNCVRRNISETCTWTSRKERRPRQSTSQVPESHVRHPTPQLPLPAQVHSQPPRNADTAKLQHLGRLFKARGAPSYHGDSYFGHQSAAVMMQATTPEMSTGPDVGLSHRARITATQPFRNERGPYAQLWELVGSLPRQKAVADHLIQNFFVELNPTFDSVHEETFRVHYDAFWDRKRGFDDLSTIDIRWLSLLFIILAFGELIDCPQPCSVETQRACEDSSLHFYWTARKSLVIAPSFFGESPDMVRAGILITRYLIHARRISESWLTVSFAVRMAQGQGMHVDGEHLGLPRKATETRRRLWSQLYTLDRKIALALGRPNSINDRHCNYKDAGNVWVDEMTNEQAQLAQSKSILEPTPAVLSIFRYRLAVIIGHIQDDCFSLMSALHDTSYDKVLKHDSCLLAWKNDLPPYFRLEGADTSLDTSHPYLSWHRLYLHAAYHFTRITLHRSYLLRPSFTDRFQYSRNACINSACADLRNQLAFRNPSMVDRLKSNIAAHQLFNSALILGVIAVRDPYSAQTEAILEDLQAYCEKQNADTWVNEFGLAEVRVVELCIARTRQARAASWQASGTKNLHANSGCFENRIRSSSDNNPVGESNTNQPVYPHTSNVPELSTFQPPNDGLSDMWSDPLYFFPEPMDYQIWEGLLENLAPAK